MLGPTLSVAYGRCATAKAVPRPTGIWDWRVVNGNPPYVCTSGSDPQISASASPEERVRLRKENVVKTQYSKGILGPEYRHSRPSNRPALGHRVSGWRIGKTGVLIVICVTNLSRWMSHSVVSGDAVFGKPSLALTDMTDGQLQSPKEPSKGFLNPGKWFKKTFSRSHSRSTSPQPSASGQENRGGEISSVQHAIVSSGAQSIDPVIGASAATSQQGIYHVSLSRRWSAQPKMQIFAHQPSYQDRSHPPQVQAHLDLQWLRVRNFESICHSSN